MIALERAKEKAWERVQEREIERGFESSRGFKFKTLNLELEEPCHVYHVGCCID